MRDLILDDPSMLWTLLLVPLALAWRRRHRPSTVVFAPGEFLDPPLPQTLRTRLRLLPLLLQVPDGPELGFLTTVTVFNAPQNVTLAELRLEQFFPLDDDTARRCEELFG